MIELIKTAGTDPAFHQLIQLLDADLVVVDGDAHPFFAQFNGTNDIHQVIIAYDGDTPVGCGAIKHFNEYTMEVKRMFVHPTYRGKGIAAQILKELENWSLELNYTHCILETGELLHSAIQLYLKSGYSRIPNYGQYIGVASSVCMLKSL